jgi:hypothetical protein
MEGYKCDFCGEFMETPNDPFATIRAGEWQTVIRYEGKSTRMGFYMDCCSFCWPALEDRIENKEGE